MVPLTDCDVPGWWERLGLPGLVDIHTHFLPERMMRRVWAHFDEAGPLIGRPWPITYRSDQESRLAYLRQLGIRRFTALTYAHRPGMAADLTDFALDLAATEPGLCPQRDVLSRRRCSGPREVSPRARCKGVQDPRSGGRI